jgi:CO/xanthine dehydrogenase FAD-binding subunit
MRGFELIEPRSLAEACAILANIGDDTKVVADGAALLTIIKQGCFCRKSW